MIELSEASFAEDELGEVTGDSSEPDGRSLPWEEPQGDEAAAGMSRQQPPGRPQDMLDGGAARNPPTSSVASSLSVDDSTKLMSCDSASSPRRSSTMKVLAASSIGL